MTLSVNLVEAVWIALNLSTTVLTVAALADALADRTAVRLLNGHANELAAAGIVRRESFRLVVQGLLLAAVVPGLFTAGEATFTPTVLFLMAVPLVLFVNSAFDARERKTMTIMVAADLLAEKLNARIADTVEQTAVTAEHTAEQVDEIHDATVGKP